MDTQAWLLEITTSSSEIFKTSHNERDLIATAFSNLVYVSDFGILQSL